MDSLRTGALIGAAVLVLLLPPARGLSLPGAAVAAAVQPVSKHRVGVQASFGAETPSEDARKIATWALFSGDNQGKSVVLLDKKGAHVYVFAPDGALLGATPVLLGSAVGDHTVAGVGGKPISQVLPEERTTPAGRFVAQYGSSTTGEDVVWVDYDAAVSMHRVRANVASERRLERLASPGVDDNRISYGCINMPVPFFENVLRPAVKSGGAVVYVLPEIKTLAEVFNTPDAPAQAQLANR